METTTLIILVLIGILSVINIIIIFILSERCDRKEAVIKKKEKEINELHLEIDRVNDKATETMEEEVNKRVNTIEDDLLKKEVVLKDKVLGLEFCIKGILEERDNLRYDKNALQTKLRYANKSKDKFKKLYKDNK